MPTVPTVPHDAEYDACDASHEHAAIIDAHQYQVLDVMHTNNRLVVLRWLWRKLALGLQCTEIVIEIPPSDTDTVHSLTIETGVVCLNAPLVHS